MKTLMTLLTIIALAGGCRTAAPLSRPAADPTYTETTTTDRRGNTVTNTVDNRGKAAAAEGQAMLTTEDVWKKLVTKLPANESPLYGWTMTETAYSIHDLPNQIVIDQLKEKHKNILAEASRLAEAGMTKDYGEAISAAASIASEIARLLKGDGDKSDGGDRGSLINRTISVGPDHTVVPLAQATEMGLAVRSRHGNQNTVSHTTTVEREDTSTTEEIVAALDAGVRKEELRLAYTLAQAAMDAKEDPKPDQVNTPVVPSPEIPGHVEPATISTDGDQTFLWKPKSDSNGKLVVIFPASFNGRLSNVAVNGERGTFSSVANGNRSHYRFGKTGSAYSAPAKITATIDGKTAWSTTVNSPGLRTSIPGLKPPEKTVAASDLIPEDPMEHPAQPLPDATTPNDGDAAAPGESPAQ
jgi:hypothetical protein